MNTSPQLLPEGTRFTFDDLVFWQGKKPGDTFDEAIAMRIRVVILSPHASGVIPGELAPFISPSLTKRKQYDFSDVPYRYPNQGWPHGLNS